MQGKTSPFWLQITTSLLQIGHQIKERFGREENYENKRCSPMGVRRLLSRGGQNILFAENNKKHTIFLKKSPKSYFILPPPPPQKKKNCSCRTILPSSQEIKIWSCVQSICYCMKRGKKMEAATHLKWLIYILIQIILLRLHF